MTANDDLQSSIAEHCSAIRHDLVKLKSYMPQTSDGDRAKALADVADQLSQQIEILVLTARGVVGDFADPTGDP